MGETRIPVAQFLYRVQEWSRLPLFPEFLQRVGEYLVREFRATHCEFLVPGVEEERRNALMAILREVMEERVGRNIDDGLPPVRSLLVEPIIYGRAALGSVGVGREGGFGPRDWERFREYVRVLAVVVAARLSADKAEWCETALEERRRQLEALRHQLLHSGKLAAVGQLAAGIAHELNSPLGAIVTGIQGLLLAPGDAKTVAEDARVILAAANRCREIAQRLLDYAREVPIEVRPVDLNEVIEEAARLLAHVMAMAQIQVVREYRHIPPVSGSRDELMQLVTNLLTNARDAIVAGKRLLRQGLIKIRTAVEEVGSRVVVLTIEDTGVGIPPGILGRVFDPFFTTKEPGKGTGLGLTICKGIVERHGGTIGVTSEEGRGTIVQVRLPAAEEGRRPA